MPSSAGRLAMKSPPTPRRAGSSAAGWVGAHGHDARPPLRVAVIVGEHGPHLVRRAPEIDRRTEVDVHNPDNRPHDIHLPQAGQQDRALSTRRPTAKRAVLPPTGRLRRRFSPAELTTDLVADADGDGCLAAAALAREAVAVPMAIFGSA